MKIYSVYDKEFAPYGKIIDNIDTTELFSAMEKTPIGDGVEYVGSYAPLEALDIMKIFENNIYGGMPVQLGYCNGQNRTLNCLEYHRDSEINFGATDFILLLAKEENIIDGKLDTATVEAFHCPKNVLLEVYATALHYAPCSCEKGADFKVLVALPKGTNTPKPEMTNISSEDKFLWARNKWLLAHADSSEASNGAEIALVGENICLD